MQEGIASIMAKSQYVNSRPAHDIPEPSLWGRHLGVSADVADGLYSDQLGALIFVRKLVRCGYLFNTVVGVLVWAGIAVWGRYSGPRTFRECSSVPGLHAGCDPALASWILGTASGFVIAAAVFVLMSLPCLVVGYAVRWSAKAMAERN
ncbi:hypothetical protein [Nocardia seriolae]|nr:hypothetical protein [Nocardia seriolae]MTK41463.1 hypothetical protein [Nocardia seriolae]OJF80481.1 hypothetical protein NS14008_16345 [Nocardia seriolae]PSK30571.1 hypothetical protein C6575_14960 [Nocardia seriolae]RLP30853.1 hypothetical protein D6158_16370 [Nocardia seriolae]WKY55939.1 hypothetical protein Q5P07_19110 [Nocardia seriolae]